MATEITRIALIGAPGSGKSELAEAIRSAREERGERYRVVDDYVTWLENSTGLAFGYLAEFIPNLMVATSRLACEFDVSKHGSYIVCGTVVETAAYCSIKAVQQMEATNGKALNRIQATMDTLTMILMDNWNYDYAFYLPLPQSHEDDWDKRLDLNIREALAMLHVDHVPLIEEDQAAQALRILNVETTDSTE